MIDLNLLSETILLAVKKKEEYDFLVIELSNSARSDLSALRSDKQIIAFWVNVYNAFFQILSVKNPKIGKSIYKQPLINIAGKLFSLDDVEHGILRVGKSKLSLGFWRSIRKYRSLRKLRPSRLDYRIHFALNCGACSCPPIAFYDAENVYSQLDMATGSFLESETEIDEKNKIVSVSKLFLWFYNDFGRKSGTLAILSKYLVKNFKGYKIEYLPYDWTSALRAFN